MKVIMNYVFFISAALSPDVKTQSSQNTIANSNPSQTAGRNTMVKLVKMT